LLGPETRGGGGGVSNNLGPAKLISKGETPVDPARKISFHTGRGKKKVQKIGKRRGKGGKQQKLQQVG